MNKIKYLIYRFKWNYFPKLNIIPCCPIHLDVELTNNCNLKCKMCVHSSDKKNFSIGNMRYDLAEQIIIEAAAIGVSSIKFNWRGEPTLYKRLPDIIKFAKNLGILEVAINTNGLLLDTDFSKNLIESGLDKIIFSVDGMTNTSYKKARGANLQKLLHNINNFYTTRNLEKSNCKIKIQMVKNSYNESEVDYFMEYWKNYADEIRITNCADRSTNKEILLDGRKIVGRKNCYFPWQRLTIAWNGSVYACCADWFGKYKVGNIKKKSIKKIWKNEAMNVIRKKLLNNNFELSVCSNCMSNESYIFEVTE